MEQSHIHMVHEYLVIGLTLNDLQSHIHMVHEYLQWLV